MKGMKDVIDEKNEDVKSLFQLTLNSEFGKTLSEIKIKQLERNNSDDSESSTDPTQDFDQYYKSFPKVYQLDDKPEEQKVLCLKTAIICLSIALIAVSIGCTLLVFNVQFLTEPKNQIRSNAISLLMQRKDLILLELPERGTFSLSTALSNCLGLKSSSYNPTTVSYKNNSIDFFSDDSLCNKELDDRVLTFVIFQNPAIRIYKDYYKIKHTNYDLKIPFMNFSQYLEYTEDNSLVRSILCKNEGKITDDDFNKAMLFLKERSFTFVNKNYKKISEAFLNIFRPDIEESKVSKCVEDEYKRTLQRARYLQDDISVYLNQMYQFSFYDFKIYQKFASEED